MPQDNVYEFSTDPVAFIARHPIVLKYIAQDMGGGFPVVNNQRTRFTLSTNTVNGMPGPNDFPTLRMQPGGGSAVVGGLTTLDAMYCHAGVGAITLNALPFCDIPVTPGAEDAHLLFTTGMSGCTLVVASAVPPEVPALAPEQWRVMHDPRHRSLVKWASAGYTVRFASYADATEPGPVPPDMAPSPIVNTYNPHDYPWNFEPPPDNTQRIVTNFLYWNGTNWTFNSRHYCETGTVPYDMDVPRVGGIGISTQSINL